MISFQEIKEGNLEICEEKFDNVLHNGLKRSKLLKSGIILPCYERQTFTMYGVRVGLI